MHICSFPVRLISDSNHVNAAVLREANRSDNRRKLGAASTDERHLFVYLHESVPDAWVALLASVPPNGRLELPPEVTHVWAATHHFADGQIVYWCGDSAGWFRFDQTLDLSAA